MGWATWRATDAHFRIACAFRALALWVFAVRVLSGCATEPAADDGHLSLTPGIWDDEIERGVPLDAPHVSGGGLALTKLSEGWRSHLYEDAATHCSIGYGHLVHRNHCDGQVSERPFLRGITLDAGSELLASDMQLAERGVWRLVSRSLTDNQYAALCDFVYNVGVTRFASSSLLSAVNARDTAAIPRQFMRWIYAGGKEWPGLKVRRQREADMFMIDEIVTRGGPGPAYDEAPIDILIGEVPRP